MDYKNYKEMLEREKFEKLMQNNECFIFKAAVPTHNEKESPMAIFEGTADTMEVAIMINFLEGALKSIKKSFPTETFLAGLMGSRNVSESYSNIEKTKE